MFKMQQLVKKHWKKKRNKTKKKKVLIKKSKKICEKKYENSFKIPMRYTRKMSKGV